MDKAVITADIIHSSKMPEDDRAMLYKNIKESLKVIDKDYAIHSEIYRGDSFQSVVDNVADALRIALIIKTFIRSLNPSEPIDIEKKGKPDSRYTIASPVWMFDVRMAIGIGKVKLRVDKITASDGEAFQLSGRALDELKNTRYRFAIDSNDANKNALIVQSKMLDTIISKTTALQCEVINLKLLGYTEVEISKMLAIKQSAVNQRSVSGNWNVINEMVLYFENLYANE